MTCIYGSIFNVLGGMVWGQVKIWESKGKYDVNMFLGIVYPMNE